MPSAEESWHLDKKVPIALIFAILLQTVAFAWWGATLTARVDFLERQIAENQGQGDRIVRLEEQMKYIAEGVTEIKMILREKPR